MSILSDVLCEKKSCGWLWISKQCTKNLSFVAIFLAMPIAMEQMTCMGHDVWARMFKSVSATNVWDLIVSSTTVYKTKFAVINCESI